MWKASASVLIMLSVGCAGGDTPESASPATVRAPALSAAAAAPAPITPGPQDVTLSTAERAQETAWLSSFGLTVPEGGVLLRSPFALPLTRRSFVVPTSWYRDKPEQTRAGAMCGDFVAAPRGVGARTAALARSGKAALCRGSGARATCPSSHPGAEYSQCQVK